MSPRTQVRMASFSDRGSSIGRPSVGDVFAAAFIVACASQYSTKLKLDSIVCSSGCRTADLVHALTSLIASSCAWSSNSVFWTAAGFVALRRPSKIWAGVCGPCQLTCAARYPVQTFMASCSLSVSPLTLMMLLALSLVLMFFCMRLWSCGDSKMVVFVFLTIVAISAFQ